MAETPDYHPAGFCPKCGYAMDPGCCPECGADVSAKRFARSRHAHKRRKEMVVGLVVGASIGIILWALRDGLPGVAPTTMLLSRYVDQDPIIARELWWRCEQGRLSNEQVSRLLDLGLVARDELGIEAVYPSGASLDASLRINLDRGLASVFRTGRVERGPRTLCVDDVEILAWPLGAGGTSVSSLAIDVDGWMLTWMVPPLSAGEHRIDVSQELYLVTGEGGGAKRTHTWVLSATGLVLIEEPPIAGLYVPILDEDIALQVEQAVEVIAADEQAVSNGCDLICHIHRAPVRIAMSVWTRVTGEGAYFPVRYDLCAGPGESRSGFIALDGVPGIEGATHVDVRLVPFPWGADVVEENRRYYGHLIERLGIPLRDASESENEFSP